MVVRILSHEIEGHISPHAIVWRPIEYFTLHTRSGVDELDEYKGASFSIGNDIQFELRRYRGHPALTVSVYLPLGEESEEQINEILDTIFREMHVPELAVAWRRGQPVTFGQLSRPANDRLFEPEARILTLKIAAQAPDHSATTSFIKAQVPNFTELSNADRTISKSRPTEQLWQQIVGNVRVHHDAASSIYTLGYAARVPNGTQVTRAGAIYLSNMGYMSLSPEELETYLAL